MIKKWSEQRNSRTVYVDCCIHTEFGTTSLPPPLWCRPSEKSSPFRFCLEVFGLQRCTDSSANNSFLMRLSCLFSVQIFYVAKPSNLIVDEFEVISPLNKIGHFSFYQWSNCNMEVYHIYTLFNSGRPFMLMQRQVCCFWENKILLCSLAMTCVTLDSSWSCSLC